MDKMHSNLDGGFAFIPANRIIFVQQSCMKEVVQRGQVRVTASVKDQSEVDETRSESMMRPQLMATAVSGISGVG
jgi:hypothetical protein